jgi:signal transduction histidine kinase
VEERTAALRAAEVELAEREKMDALGRLAGGVAHDMNNVLTAIHASASLAREEPERAGAYLDEIDAACERAARLTEQLLATARGQASAPSTLDLRGELERQLPYLRRVVGDGVRVILEEGAPGLHVFMDRGHLEQVLQNLAANARDAMGGTGSLRLSASGESDRVVLRVHDSGPGVPMARRPRIFEPFYTTKPAREGTGLGLSVTHGIVAQAGGDIAIEDVPEGCCFRIRVPRARPEAVSPRSP